MGGKLCWTIYALTIRLKIEVDILPNILQDFFFIL